MGSAIPKPRDPSYVCGLFLEIVRRAEAASERAEEPDDLAVAAMFADAFSHPDSRNALLLALAHFVNATVVGAPPNLRRWNPPEP